MNARLLGPRALPVAGDVILPRLFAAVLLMLPILTAAAQDRQERVSRSSVIGGGSYLYVELAFGCELVALGLRVFHTP